MRTSGPASSSATPMKWESENVDETIESSSSRPIVSKNRTGILTSLRGKLQMGLVAVAVGLAAILLVGLALLAWSLKPVAKERPVERGVELISLRRKTEQDLSEEEDEERTRLT